jgi:glycosyltransferase involved in cell wall biosynthesis
VWSVRAASMWCDNGMTERRSTDASGAFLWLDEAQPQQTARLVEEIRGCWSGPIIVIGRRGTSEYCSPKAEFLAFEDLTTGHIHPDAVYGEDAFVAARTILAVVGFRDLRRGVFFSNDVTVRGWPTEADLAPSGFDAGLGFAQPSIAATARFPFAQVGPGLATPTDDLCWFEFRGDSAQVLYETVISGCAATMPRSLRDVAISAMAALANLPFGRVQMLRGSLAHWSAFCRAELGDEVALHQPVIHVRELLDFLDRGSRVDRIVDHDDFLLQHRVHGLEPLQDLIERHSRHRFIARTQNREGHQLLADIRRTADPFARRWTASDSSDFFGWLAERNSHGLTRLSEILLASQPSIAPGVDRINSNASQTLKWLSDLGPQVFGLDPQGSRDSLAVAASGVSTSAEPKSALGRGLRLGPLPDYLHDRLHVRRAAVAPHLGPIRWHGREIVRHMLPYRARVGLRKRRNAIELPSLRGAGRFGSGSLTGLSVVGPYRNLSGLSVAMHASIEALEQAGVRFDVWDTSDFLPTKTLKPADDHLPFAAGDVNLLHLNINEVIPKLQHDLRYGIGGRYNIGYWFWETLTMPPEYASATQLLNEAWCATEFIAEVMRRRGIESSVVGLPYRLPTEADTTPCDYVRNDAFNVCFAFDCYSSIQRKNPIGVLRAFEAAFGTSRDVRLLLKAGNLVKFPKFQEFLATESDRLGNVTVIGEAMPRAQLNGLIAGSQAYISLHRSEGVGLTLLEAMALRVPSIATRYSGNLDFMNDANSTLIDGQLVTTDAQHGPYPPGTIWCEPDHDAAVDALRALRSSEPSSERLSRAVDDALRYCSLDRYKREMVAGLSRLGVASDG